MTLSSIGLLLSFCLLYFIHVNVMPFSLVLYIIQASDFDILILLCIDNASYLCPQ